MFSPQIEREYAATVDARTHALETGDVRAALTADNLLEELGMRPDDRATCYSCQSWADHAHNPVTGRRIAA